MLKIKFPLGLFKGEKGRAGGGYAVLKIKFRSGCEGRKGTRQTGNAKENNKIPFGVARGEKVLSSAAANRKKASSAVKALRQREVGFSG